MPPTSPKRRLALVITLSVVCYLAFSTSALAARCLIVAPVSAPIVEMFREPSCRWCAGKRGIEYATEPGTQVRAGVSGVVSFSGPVGGVSYVVIRSADGVLVTHGQLSEVFLHSGDDVNVGEPVGRVNNRLYFGVRIDGRYVDPLRCMARGAISITRAILVPAPRAP